MRARRHRATLPGQETKHAMRMMKFLLTCLSVLSCALVFGANAVRAQNFSVPGTAGIQASNVSVTLRSGVSDIMPGETFYVAIDQKIARGWHTYWRNPGDSGEPTSVVWTLPDGVTAGPIQWPTPTALPFGPLVNYGYSNAVTLPIQIKVPDDAVIGTTLQLAAQVRWLECSDICIPGEASVRTSVKVAGIGWVSADTILINQAVDNLPRPFGGTTALTDLGASGLQLIIKGVEVPFAAYFFPYEVKIGAIVDAAQPQKLVRGKVGFGLNLTKSPSFPTDLKDPVAGVLVLGNGPSAKAYEISAPISVASAGSVGVLPVPNAAPTPPVTNIGLWLALGFAFLGGLILNLMPCVFPILSMKALSLIEAAHNETRVARSHGLWYGAGVVASFLLLAGVLIGLTAAGIAVGWGFQLQSPAIVIVLAVLMVLIGFNLMGFFEVGTSLQNVGGSLAARSGASGSFFTGVLAVIVAAPCTAPFMGAALGYAAGQPPFIALLVFASLGIGFALPFVALTFMPGLLRALPKPGPWMSRLREGLAFPMFATAIWLLWVASAQAGQAGLLAGLIGVLAAGFAIWLSRISPGLIGKGVAAMVLIGALTWAGIHVTKTQNTDSASSTIPSKGEPWSPQRLAQLQGEGKTVFVNFTADWCVTCKVNEIGVFSDPRVQAAFSNGNGAYLVADWTKRDDTIAKTLASHGRVGVPLYMVYKGGADAAPAILPQILTADIVLDAMK